MCEKKRCRFISLETLCFSTYSWGSPEGFLSFFSGALLFLSGHLSFAGEVPQTFLKTLSDMFFLKTKRKNLLDMFSDDEK